jgi:hypothetical protein
MLTVIIITICLLPIVAFGAGYWRRVQEMDAQIPAPTIPCSCSAWRSSPMPDDDETKLLLTLAAIVAGMCQERESVSFLSDGGRFHYTGMQAVQIVQDLTKPVLSKYRSRPTS